MRALKILPVLLLLGLAGRPALAQRLATAYDSTSGTISIKATQMPLGEVVKRLQGAHHLDVFIDPATAAEPVSVDLTNVPVEDALRQVVPARSRFFFRPTSTADVTSRVPTRFTPVVQTGRQVQKPAGSQQVAPDQIRALAEAPNATRTPAIRVPISRVGEMQPVAAIRAVEGTVAQSPVATYGPVAVPVQTPADDQHVRMTVRIAADGSYQPISYQRVSGNLVEPQVAQGSYIYQAYEGDRLAFVGSFQNPLEQHSYSPDNRQHLLLPAKEVFITVALPAQFSTPAVQRTATVQFSRLDEAVLTTPLRQLPRTAPTIKNLGTIRSAELLRIPNR